MVYKIRVKVELNELDSLLNAFELALAYANCDDSIDLSNFKNKFAEHVHNLREHSGIQYEHNPYWNRGIAYLRFSSPEMKVSLDDFENKIQDVFSEFEFYDVKVNPCLVDIEEDGENWNSNSKYIEKLWPSDTPMFRSQD